MTTPTPEEALPEATPECDHFWVWTWPLDERPGTRHGSIGVCQSCHSVRTAEREADVADAAKHAVLIELVNGLPTCTEVKLGCKSFCPCSVAYATTRLDPFSMSGPSDD